MAYIAVDGRKYFDLGIGTYIRSLTDALSHLQASHHFSLLVSPGDYDTIVPPIGWQKHVVDVEKYSVREILLLGYQARRKGIDLFHEPHYTLPIGLRRKSIVTIHDLIHLKFPEYFNPAQRSYATAIMGHAVRNAGAVIAVSERTKQDIVERFRLPAESIQVVYHGLDAGFRKITDSGRRASFRGHFHLQNPFILYVGSLKPHKNVPLLLRAFQSLVTTHEDLELVFAGESLSEYSDLTALAVALGILPRIKELGRVQGEDLTLAYNVAEALALPSRYEGFGFPALEAMACGTPVVVSDGGSLPEVVGDAALVVKVDDVGALEDALRMVLNDAGLRADLRERGERNVLRFSWKKAATETLRMYESLL